ncbi:MAG: HGGxSTG domain-containing protein [Gammaproteobacteria bacterium]
MLKRGGARTRSGGFCGNHSMPNGRCQFHGGKSTGAKNPRVKHGMYTKAAIEERKFINQLLLKVRDMIVEIN